MLHDKHKRANTRRLDHQIAPADRAEPGRTQLGYLSPCMFHRSDVGDHFVISIMADNKRELM